MVWHSCPLCHSCPLLWQGIVVVVNEAVIIRTIAFSSSFAGRGHDTKTVITRAKWQLSDNTPKIRDCDKIRKTMSFMFMHGNSLLIAPTWRIDCDKIRKTMSFMFMHRNSQLIVPTWRMYFFVVIEILYVYGKKNKSTKTSTLSNFLFPVVSYFHILFVLRRGTLKSKLQLTPFLSLHYSAAAEGAGVRSDQQDQSALSSRSRGDIPKTLPSSWR